LKQKRGICEVCGQMFVSASGAIIHRLRQEGSLGIDSPDKYPIEMLIRAKYMTSQLD